MHIFEKQNLMLMMCSENKPNAGYAHRGGGE
jgi:hypothetical protein